MLVDQLGCATPPPKAPLAQNSTSLIFTCAGTNAFVSAWNKSTQTDSYLFQYPVSATFTGLGANDGWVLLAFDDLDRVPATGGNAGLVAASLGATRVAVISSLAYVLTASAVKVYKIDDAFQPDALSNLTAPIDLRVDATGLFVITDGTGAGDGTVIGKNLSGAATTTYAGPIAPRGLALDATHVYWTDGIANTIERATR